jgi:hypothetical protein
MKKILLAITLLFALPVLASAEENVSPSSEAVPKEHHMRNTDPTPTEPKEQVQEQKQEQEQEQAPAPAHTMKNN